MEVKKSKSADLEQKRSMFLQIGFVIALGVTLVAFEWKSIREDPGILAELDIPMEEEEMIPITKDKEPEVEAPKPEPIVLEELIIVDDETDIPEELEFDSESDEDLEMEFVEEEEVYSDDPIPFFSLENKPEFPGGEKELLRYLSSSVKYPVIAQENGIQGTVYLSFVISKTGKVENVGILRGVDSSVDKEAMRVVASMPDWKPGKQGTRAVAVSYQVPIKFTLQ